MTRLHSPMKIRVDKTIAGHLVAKVAPQYLELLADCKDDASWRNLAESFRKGCEQFKVESYVLLYEDERRLQSALINALLPPEAQANFAKELNALSLAEQTSQLNAFAEPGGYGDQLAKEILPDDEQLVEAQRQAFEAMSEDEKRQAARQGQFLFAFTAAWLHEALALMVHGEPMTQLVPKALAGHDDDAFLKAVHIDKNILRQHPAFVARHQRAVDEHDGSFLQAMARRQASPVTQGRIKLAGAFVTFALLESLGWLGEVTHGEIADLCDRARLDRWQNRIEDENAITKCLQKYRQYQKTGGVSMH